MIKTIQKLKVNEENKRSEGSTVKFQVKNTIIQI